MSGPQQWNLCIGPKVHGTFHLYHTEGAPVGQPGMTAEICRAFLLLPWAATRRFLSGILPAVMRITVTFMMLAGRKSKPSDKDSEAMGSTPMLCTCTDRQAAL